MKLIIDINDNEYIGIKEYPDNVTSYPVTIHLYDAVKNGIPLPKGHGRLIDADYLREDFKASKRISFAERMDISCIVDHAPTIIEADKAESEEISDRNLKMWEEIYTEEKRRIDNF